MIPSHRTDIGENISRTNNGTTIISPVRGSAETFSAYGRESVFSEDGDNKTIMFYEIIQYYPDNFEGKGIIISVFERNATDMLAPFNGMIVAGTHNEQPNTEKATITLWEWLSG
jgi:hypothetical protein